ncbi:hypothetical protein GCM10022226_20380 [Sphaerisporangium flaviroseum]|uniref:Uncharacterized protein n=1 Tax=Sphaerisporangium flaviroseum TaxID=509199 RepID=A0ABP7HT22_9ACTN
MVVGAGVTGCLVDCSVGRPVGVGAVGDGVRVAVERGRPSGDADGRRLGEGTVLRLEEAVGRGRGLGVAAGVDRPGLRAGKAVTPGDDGDVGDEVGETGPGAEVAGCSGHLRPSIGGPGVTLTSEVNDPEAMITAEARSRVPGRTPAMTSNRLRRAA